MTYEELQKQLEQYLKVPTDMIFVPRMLDMAAENLFVDEELDSEFAQIVRHQLKHLNEHGRVDVERKSK